MKNLLLGVIAGVVFWGFGSVASAAPAKPCQVENAKAKVGIAYFESLIVKQPTILELRRTCSYTCTCDIRHQHRNCHRTITLECHGQHCGPCRGEAERKAEHKCRREGEVKRCDCSKY